MCHFARDLPDRERRWRDIRERERERARKRDRERERQQRAEREREREQSRKLLIRDPQIYAMQICRDRPRSEDF